MGRASDAKVKRIRTRPVAPRHLSNLSGLHPVLARVYAARDIASPDELDLTLQHLLPYHDMKGIEQAASILGEALELEQSILIVGDFDADGATSSALAVAALTAMGAAKVDYLVPNRFDFGYGLTPEIVEVAAQRRPDVIVTVDNGISSLEGVAAANRLGIKVVITDHHLPGDSLPDAAAIVNPNQPGCAFPGKNTAGVGVIFYLMSALRQALRERNWFDHKQIADPNLGDYLDLVALGTVADVVPLDRNNRILVEQGLRRIRAGKTRFGIQTLLEVSGRDSQTLVSSDLGFAIGPRLNAAGRLDDMSLGIECLLADDYDKAYNMARQLDELNRDRKSIETAMKEQALTLLAEVEVGPEQAGLCLYDPAWHQGVIGILASRIKDKYHRPVVAFARTVEGEIKGSARSIKGFHMRDALDAVAKQNPGLLSKFGGHAMAAGLSLKEMDYPAFEQAFASVANDWLSEEQLQADIVTDGSLAPGQHDLALADLLRMAGPWGQAFHEPLFDGEFLVREQRLVGEKHLKLKLNVEGNDELLDGIAFFVDLNQWPNDAQRIRLVYRLDVNEFRGQRNVQLLAEYLEPIEE